MMLTRTSTILSAAIFLGTASAALAMSPTGSHYKPFPKAYAKVVTDTETAQSPGYLPTPAELADRQSFYYRR
jgi:hypothetical protein